MIKLISTVFVRQILVGVLQILTLIIIARVLGSKQMGQYTLAILLPTLLSQIITFGLQSINIFSVGRKLLNEKQALYCNIVILFILSISSSMILAVIIHFYGEYFFNEMPMVLLYVSIIALLPQTFFTVLPSLIQAIENFKWFNILCILQPLFIFVISVSAIVLNNSIESILAAYIISHWLTFIALLSIVFKLIKPEKFSIMTFLSSFIMYGLRSHLSNIITLLNYRSSLLILGYFTTPVTVGIYSVGMQLVEKLWLPSQAVSTVLLPRLSNQLGEGQDNQKVAKLTLDCARLTFLITILISVFFVLLLPWIINFLFGTEYNQAFYVVVLLLPGILAWTPSRILANDLAARGFAELNLKNSYWVFTINVILSIFLIPLWGLSGAAISTTVAYTIDLLLRLVAFNKVTESSVFINIIPKPSDFKVMLNFLQGIKNAK